MIPRVIRRTFSTRRPVVGGNWKLNPSSLSEVKSLVNGLNALPADACDVMICPPAAYLSVVKDAAAPHLTVAAQNCYKEDKGAYTGEVSPAQLLDMDVSTVLLGHSERRDIFGETDQLIGEKVAHCQSLGMNVCACVGEHLPDREAGNTMEVLKPQLKAIADNVSDWSRVVIAYEPVWAIGTGVVATPEQAQETCSDIRLWLRENVSSEVAESTRIQYGGSVNAENSKALSSSPDIDGFLVGGASLKPEGFGEILKSFE
eukprot:g3028.t1